MKKKSDLCWIILFPMLVFALNFCSDSGKVRKYKERRMTETQVNSHSASDSSSPNNGAMQKHSHFIWETPKGWTEDKKSSGFRIATFSIHSDQKKAICTIIPLQGEAGGLRANAARWLGQISNSMNPEEAKLNQILSEQEKFLTQGQFSAVMLDFSTAIADSASQSILATVITVGSNSIFIKMKGEKELLLKNRDKFKSLCKSFRTISKTKN